MFETVGINFQLLLVILALFAGGAVATALAGVVPRRRDLSELWRLCGTEFAIVGMVAVTATDWRVLLIALLAFGARGQFELRNLFGVVLPRWFHAVDLIAAAAVIAGGFFWDRLWESAAMAVIVVGLAGYLSVATGGRAQAAITGAAGILFPVVPIAVIGLMGRLPEGLAWLLFVFIIVETNDSFALIFGKLFGRHGILPKLSPGKTTEGAIAGLLSGSAVGMVLAMTVFGLPAGQAGASVGVVLAAGLLGDVFTSALKRATGRKDFAPVHVLHGGALDIYDSVVVAAPVFYVYHGLFLR